MAEYALRPRSGQAGFLRKTIGFTTVGAVRVLGYDVKVTRGIGFHATVEVPRDWDSARAQELARIFREAINPTPRKF